MPSDGKGKLKKFGDKLANKLKGDPVANELGKGNAAQGLAAYGLLSQKDADDTKEKHRQAAIVKAKKQLGGGSATN